MIQTRAALWTACLLSLATLLAGCQSDNAVGRAFQAAFGPRPVGSRVALARRDGAKGKAAAKVEAAAAESDPALLAAPPLRTAGSDLPDAPPPAADVLAAEPAGPAIGATVIDEEADFAGSDLQPVDPLLPPGEVSPPPTAPVPPETRAAGRSRPTAAEVMQISYDEPAADPAGIESTQLDESVPPAPPRRAAEQERVWASHTHGLPFIVGYEEGMALAKRENKPAMLFMTTTECFWCKRLARACFDRPEVQSMLAQFVLVLVDGSQERAALERYGITAFPHVVFVSPDGTVLSTQRGFMEPPQLLHLARTALGQQR